MPQAIRKNTEREEQLENYFADWTAFVDYQIEESSEVFSGSKTPRVVRRQEPTRRVDVRAAQEATRRYVPTAVAEAMPEPEREPRKALERAPQRGIRPQSQNHIRTVERPRTHTVPVRTRGKLVFMYMAILVCLVATSIIIQYADVYSKTARIEALEEEIEKARQAAGAELAALERDPTTRDVYAMATADLGMRAPTTEDVYFIELKNNDYTVFNIPQKVPEEKVKIHWFGDLW